MNTTKLHIFNLVVRLLPPSRCNNIKVALLRWAGAKVGDNVSLFSPRILGNFDLIIGNHCWIGHEAMLMGAAGSKIEMKTGSKLGTRAMLVTGYHKQNIWTTKDNGIYGNITLQPWCGVDTMSMVCPGKTIGTRSHVTACSIVRHNVPPYAVVMGSPAKVIGFYFSPDEIVEFQEAKVAEGERIPREILDRNYRKYFIDRIKEIRKFVKL